MNKGKFLTCDLREMFRMRRWPVRWLSIALVLLGTSHAAFGQSATSGAPAERQRTSRFRKAPTVPLTRPAPLASQVPLEQLPQKVRDQVRAVIEQPTVSGCGPSEEFSGRWETYQWLLDHPDRAALAWRQLGAPCLKINCRGEGCFGWHDPQGGDVSWEAIYRTPAMSIWYADGRARPGVLLPTVPVRVVLVMHHSEHDNPLGRQQIVQQADLFLQTDSAAAALIVRLFGPSIPRLTEQCLAQVEYFFSGLASHLYRHPEQAATLFPATQGD
jgi:hypothetical protein